MAAVVGLVGRRVGGERLGLLAAALAAIYPPLVANESILMSESLYGLMIALTILTALWASEAPTWRRAAVLGAVIGLDALTRAEGLLLLVLLVPFVVRRVRPGASRRYLVALAAAAVVVAPWCVRNSLQFDRPLGISTGDGAVLAGANNEISYHGDRTGTWQFSALAVPASAGVDPHDDADIGEYQRGKGLDYLRAHDGRVPLVALARVLRTWGLFPLDPSTHAHQESFTSGRRLSVAWVTLAAGWAATALALGGALLLRRRGLLCAALLAPIALVTIDSAVFYGDVRFREAADISLVVLAAVALTHVYTLARGR
jgi:hypothetical protein